MSSLCTIIANDPIGRKWKAHKLTSNRAVNAMFLAAEYAANPADWNRRAYLMSECASNLIYKYCPDCESLHLARTWLCRDRLCPICSWRLSLKRAGEMQLVLADLLASNKDVIPEMLTLTVKNMPLNELNSTIKTMFDAWALIRKRRTIKASVLGFARSLEITRDKKGLYHPHLHILLLSKPDKPINQREWCEYWKQANHLDYTPICYIERAYSKTQDNKKEYNDLTRAAVESLKYAIKSDTLANIPPWELPLLAGVLKNKRLVTYGGLIATYREKLKLSSEEYTDLAGEMSIECPDCGCTNVELLAYKWSIESGSYVREA